MAAAGATPTAASGNAGGVAPLVPRDKLVELLVSHALKKGDGGLRELEARAASGQGFNVKGMHIDVGIVRDALAKASKASKAVPQTQTPTPQGGVSLPASAGALARANAVPLAQRLGVPTPAAAPIARWTPEAPTASSLAAKAVSECDKAEPFVKSVKVVGTTKVAILQKPTLAGKATEEYLQPEQVVEVMARSTSVKDGRVYLRLKSASGWVSTRSRKDFTKVVLAAVDPSVQLEPAAFKTPPESQAMPILPHVDENGKDVTLPTLSNPRREPQKFRAVINRVNILSFPSLTGGTTSNGAMLQVKEQFAADAVHFSTSEHRAYLRLADGRGWICERARADIHRLAVFPLNASFVDEPEVEKKETTVAILQRAADAEAPKKRAAAREEMKTALAVYRSDTSLWPESTGPPRPILPGTRAKLSQLRDFFGEQVADSEQDLKEVTEKADSYARTCPAEKTLREHIEKLKKEIANTNKEWVAEVEKVLKADSVEKSANDVPKESSDGLTPVQVNGERWYCANIRGTSLEVDGKVTKHLGPLRAAAEEARSDLERMRQHLKESILKESSSVGAGEAVPPEKKRRTAKA